MNNTNDSATPQPAAPAPATPTPISRWIIPVPIAAPAAAEAAKAGVSANGSNGNGHHPPEPPTAPAQPADLLTNYITNRLDNGQTQRIALTLPEITTRIYRLTDGWPRRVGSRLFVDLGHPRPLRWLDSVDDLFAWLHTIAPAPGLSWGISDDDFGTTLITQRQLFAHLTACAVAYDAAESLPYWPPVPTVYSSWLEQQSAKFCDPNRVDTPEEIAAATDLFNQFLAFFNPDSDVDRALMLALFLTPFWGGEAGSRPLIVVTTADETSQQMEQEAGKSMLIEKLTAVAGGAFDAAEDDKRNTGDALAKRILSPIAMQYRVCIIDNKHGVLADPSLAKLITQKVITDRPAYGKQTSRPNRLLWTVTANTVDTDGDFARRILILRIRHPKKLDATWERRVDQFINDNRENLIRSAMVLLNAPPLTDPSELSEIHTRFSIWDDAVLAKSAHAVAVLKKRFSDIEAANVESSDCALFCSQMRKRFAGQHEVELEPEALSDCWNVALGTKKEIRWVMRIIRHHHKKGRLPMLRIKWVKSHGSPWVLNMPKLQEFLQLAESEES